MGPDTGELGVGGNSKGRGRPRRVASSDQRQAKARRVKFAQGLAGGQLNQEQAAIEAGYKPGPGLKGQASRLAKHADVLAEMAKIQAAAAEKAKATLAETLELLTRHVRTGGILNEDGTLNVQRVVEMDRQGCLENFEETETSYTDRDGNTERTIRRKVKLESRHGAIDRLAKLVGWNKPEEVKHSGAVEVVATLTSELVKRAEELAAKARNKAG